MSELSAMPVPLPDAREGEPRQLGRNYGLDVLRAAAILLVVSCHALFFVIQLAPEAATVKQISYFCGFWGVELFFILSGFLIGRIIREWVGSGADHWLLSFWIRRWFRTLPCYLLFLALNLLWYFFQYATWPESWAYYLIFSQNLAWPHPAFFPESWSLAVEEYFYLLFPLAIVLLRKVRLQPATAYLTAGALLFLGPTVLRLVDAALDPALSWDGGIRKVVIFRLDALMYGIYLSWFIDRIWRGRWQKPLFGLGVICLAISLLGYFRLDFDHSYFLKTVEFSVTSLGFMLIVPWMLELKLAERTSIGGLLRKTALWSYSMYLSNFLIYNIIQTLVFPRYFADSPNLGVLCCMALMIAGSYLLSALVYRTFEWPIMRRRENVIAWLRKNRNDLKEATP